ncbi:DUF3017 domain-containing protein [Propionimicrobium sp. PCR01-08-3]|uniref:DUF3017 domain-containing protein n=1 Tax=Propionimicrobium sp. PCR01-08-3 TaxID=3052086 RepID=UPI00255CDE88|nr:DUF3017 domain-containing protein [Propionimicrobium sp. PCR01-08-3]WIY83275.1 DUF3017 domain-containing protein [Propionimicrobium sp. PCR01-08-3]
MNDRSTAPGEDDLAQDLSGQPADASGPATIVAAPEEALARGRRSEVLSPWPLLAVLAVFAIGILLVVNWHWRRGSVLIGGAVVLAGGLRLILPPKWVGLLKVRNKAFDVALMAGLGVAIMVLGMAVPGVYVP